jgi:hypothetical protein
MEKNNIPGPQAGLNEIIDAFTMQIIEEKAKKNKFNPLRPSSAGKCEKELGYELMEYKGLATYDKELLPPAVNRLLNLGHQIERHANYEAEAAPLHHLFLTFGFVPSELLPPPGAEA